MARLLANLLVSICVLAACDQAQFSLELPPAPRSAYTGPGADMRPELTALEHRFERMAQECRAAVVQTRRDGFGHVGGYEVSYEVLLDDARLFSLLINAQMACSGPYPMETKIGFTLERETGKQYDVLQLYRVGRRDGESVLLIPEVQAMVQRVALQSLSEGFDDVERLRCEEVIGDTEIASAARAETLAIANAGLIVVLDVPRVIRGCYPEKITIPFEWLRAQRISSQAQRIGWTM